MRLLHHSGILAGLAALLAGCGVADRAGSNIDQDANTPIIEIAVAAQDVQPVVIELFTSQGCSSCPPADRLVGELVDDPALVIISRPVTYWDRLGWRDTLAREENTELQRAYAPRLTRGGGRSYTPQAVVNGEIGLIGSRRAELHSAIAEVQETQSDLSIEIQGNAANGYRVSVDGNLSGTATIRLLALDSSETVGIGRGENGGHSVTYTNILLGERDLTQWAGGSIVINIDPDTLKTENSDRHAIVVRDGIAGPILAARYLEEI